MVIRRAEVWWADLPAPVGSAPGYRRPVLVVQSDRLNRTRLPTAICAILTSNIRLAAPLGNVLLPSSATGLPRDSVVNVSQLVTLDHAQLTERVGQIHEGLMALVDSGLRLSLGL